MGYAEFEASLEEWERAREIYEVAINQAQIDMPEVVWQSYLEMEINLKEHGKARELYKRLLKRSKHIKVWLSYCKFEQDADAERAREVFSQAYNHFKGIPDMKEERLMVLEHWLAFE